MFKEIGKLEATKSLIKEMIGIDDADGDQENLAEDSPVTEFSAVSRLLAMRNRKDKSDRDSTPDFGGFSGISKSTDFHFLFVSGCTFWLKISFACTSDLSIGGRILFVLIP